MYINLVNRVLREALAGHIARTGGDEATTLRTVREHIDRTSEQHQSGSPEIDYEDSLCRLGYLYRHATANATLFERVLGTSRLAGDAVEQPEGQRLRICAVGGGPGTELLGLAKFLSSKGIVPSRIDFTVLDNVPQWAETWTLLADAVEGEMEAVAAARARPTPAISPQFLPMDVLAPASYSSYSTQFRNADLIVFNYLFSENKDNLASAGDAVRHLTAEAKLGCVFVVIDRLENAPAFQDGVATIFRSAGFDVPSPLPTIGATCDFDEQISDLEPTFRSILGAPRIKFFTDGHRNPTVFWFAVVKT